MHLPNYQQASIKLQQSQRAHQFTKQNDSLNSNLTVSAKAQFNHSIVISQIMTTHKSKLRTLKRAHKIIQATYIIFKGYIIINISVSQSYLRRTKMKSQLTLSQNGIVQVRKLKSKLIFVDDNDVICTNLIKTCTIYNFSENNILF
ncbi:Hypothetical_protein [Hexamita inflata]|uniref:Hypothetical_protein n=1 Tax=Hexamita inflata TaxID=28002 RepID=A0AA86Q7S3_9EUKA|nr:Hypothetical protein HINF_LOCUS41361 [Hexamita inflata]